MKLGKPSKKATVVGLSGVLVIVIVGLLVAYGLSIWPQQQAKVGKNSSSDSKQTVKTETPVPVTVEAIKSPVDKSKEVKILHTFIVIKTKEQGDCTLTLSNAKNTYTAHNSSKGLNTVGCPEWHVSTENMVEGDYDLTVEFIGIKDHAIVKQKVTI